MLMFLILYSGYRKGMVGNRKQTLPSLWISILEILRSGLSDVWLPCVAPLLC